jgi:hypothetical protein
MGPLGSPFGRRNYPDGRRKIASVWGMIDGRDTFRV